LESSRALSAQPEPEMERLQGSREIRQCFAQGFLVNRLVGYCDRVTVSLYEPHFRGFRLHGLKLAKQISIGGDLDVKTITWSGLSQHHALFVVGYHCHGGIILPQPPIFNRFSQCRNMAHLVNVRKVELEQLNLRPSLTTEPAASAFKKKPAKDYGTR